MARKTAKAIIEQARHETAGQTGDRGTAFTADELDRMAADEDARYAAGEDDGDADWALDDGHDAGGSRAMSIRLPAATIAALKRAAETRGVGATVLARQWITERLATEGDAETGGTLDVGELLDYIAEHARRVR